MHKNYISSNTINDGIKHRKKDMGEKSIFVEILN
jgi:hypothetical protein